MIQYMKIVLDFTIGFKTSSCVYRIIICVQTQSGGEYPGSPPNAEKRALSGQVNEVTSPACSCSSNNSFDIEGLSRLLILIHLVYLASDIGFAESAFRRPDTSSSRMCNFP